MKISEKTLQELEFPVLRQELESLCHFKRSKDIASQLKPIANVEKHKYELQSCIELYNCFENGENLPAFAVGEIKEGIEKLKIPGLQLSADLFLPILDTCLAFKSIQNFFKKRKELYPLINERFERIEYLKIVEDKITQVFDKEGNIKSNASKKLLGIRQSLSGKSQELMRLFQYALNQALQGDHLAETRESIVQGKRVLSVLSERKKQVKGRILGLSNTGQVTYIEPESTIECSNDLVFLENQEKNEIIKILIGLGTELRPYLEELSAYHFHLSWLDLSRAKALLARKQKAVFPKINYEKQELVLKRAFHPVLKLKSPNPDTIQPHDIRLNQKQRMLVISGPNAGGKSIALKTVGLLQIMVQSGLAIPVAEGSLMGWFQDIFSDIGDNQSIENELSTYSYRLKQMQLFLGSASSNSLVLIDEFGSGSDPELGGALAEACLEALYNKGAYGVLTTHYGNIKVLVDRLPEAENASMLFNMDTLTPLFKLKIGNAGSSFTFEVAQKMGISKKLLNQAEKKVNAKKISLDRSLSKVQSYESELKTKLNKYDSATASKEKAEEDLSLRSEYFEQQYQQLQALLQNADKHIRLGRKFETLIATFPGPNKNENWTRQLHQYLIKEKIKLDIKEKQTAPPKAKLTKKATHKPQKTITENQLLGKAKTAIPKKKSEKELPPKEVKVGSKVSILGSATKGRVIKIEKKLAWVEISGFQSKVDLKNLTAI